MAKKLFHEIPQQEVGKLISDKKTWGFIIKNYLRPKWCSDPGALDGKFGCWSLTDLKAGGDRTKISNDYCKTCMAYVGKSVKVKQSK